MDGASQSLCDESEPGDICEVSKTWNLYEFVMKNGRMDIFIL